MVASKLQGTIVKKCDMTGHKPDKRKDCGNKACQHTCTDIERCTHKWTLRYTVNGKQREESFADQVNKNTGRVSYGSGRKLAEDRQLEISHGKRAGDVVFIGKNAGKDDFCEAVEAFISSNRKTQPQTKESYRCILRAQIMPVFKGRTLAQAANMRDEADTLLNVAMLDQAVNRRRSARRLIVGTLDVAVQAEKIARHKLAGIDLSDKPVMESDDDESNGFVHITDAQVKALAEGMTHWDGKAMRKVTGVGIAVWLQRTMGLRVGEALGVEKSDFINGGRTLRLRWQSARDGKSRIPLKHRKQGQGRDVPVPAFVWAMVRDMPEGPLCPGKGTRYATYNGVRTKFVAITRALGITGFTTHSLRHAYATDSLGEGMNIANLSKILGHKDASVTMAIYVHESADWSEDARSRMDARWSQAA